MKKESHLIHYQSANEGYEQITENFIVRKLEFDTVIGSIRNTPKDSSLQHYIFTGRRGSGKSTLLKRLEAEINLDEALSDKFISVNLSEEQTGIYRLHDLWDYVLRHFKGVKIEIEELDFRKFKDTQAYTQALYSQIIQILKIEQKQLVLLIDNIDRIFNNIADDNALFREQLINHNELRIIGASTVMVDHYWKYEHPFYRFFDVRELKALTIKEIQTLLDHWSVVMDNSDIKDFLKKHPGKIQAIRMLTDGTPRTMLIFIDMLVNREMQYGFDYLRKIVDLATPIYQERLGTMSPAQKKVLAELSFFWDAASVEDLVPKCKMEGKVISALLNKLYHMRYIEKVKGETKNLLYRLEERFFNLWLIMSQGGPAEKQEAKYLTKFLENWYDQEELQGVGREFLQQLKDEDLNPHYKQSMTAALKHSKYLSPDIKEAMQEHTSNIDDSSIGIKINQAIKDKSYDALLDLLQVPIKGISEQSRFYNLARTHQALKQNKNAEKYYLLAIEKGDVASMYNLANLYEDLGKKDNAEKYYMLAIENGHVAAMYNLALLYHGLGKKEDAEKYYILAIEKGHVAAMYNLANHYKDLGKKEDAEKYYILAIEKGHVAAMYNLANHYKDLGKKEDAEKYYILAIEKGHVAAMYNLANHYKDLGKKEDAEKYYILAIEKGHVAAMYNLALLYHGLGKKEDAEKYYMLAIEKGDVDAMYNLANHYKDLGKKEDAEKYYILAIEKGDVAAMFNLAILYEDLGKKEDAEKYYILAIEKGHVAAMYNLANHYKDLGKKEDAEKYYMLAIENGHVAAMYNLALLYHGLGKKDNAEKYYILAIEKGHVAAMYNLSVLYHELNEKPKLDQSLLRDLKATKKDSPHKLQIWSYLNLWLGKLDVFEKSIQTIFESLEYSEIYDWYIQALLTHKQSQTVLELYDKWPELKERYKSYWYVTLSLIGNQKQALLKMPPEIQENVNDILDQIGEKQTFYYG